MQIRCKLLFRGLSHGVFTSISKYAHSESSRASKQHGTMLCAEEALRNHNALLWQRVSNRFFTVTRNGSRALWLLIVFRSLCRRQRRRQSCLIHLQKNILLFIFYSRNIEFLHGIYNLPKLPHIISKFSYQIYHLNIIVSKITSRNYHIANIIYWNNHIIEIHIYHCTISFSSELLEVTCLQVPQA